MTNKVQSKKEKDDNKEEGEYHKGRRKTAI